MPEENDRMVQQLRIENVDATSMTVIQQQTVNSSPNYFGKAGKSRRKLHTMEKMIWDLLAALPDPKLKSLEKLVVAMACQQFGNQKNAGGYLGLSQARVSQFMKDDAYELKMHVAKSLWNAGKKHNILGPGAVVPVDSFKELEAIPEAVVEQDPDRMLMERLIAEGRILVSEINRNEL